MDQLSKIKNMIQVLQQLQRLMSISSTLSDVAELLACFEAEFGEESLLEDVIQHLVGEHIAAQIAQRSPRQEDLEVAA